MCGNSNIFSLLKGIFFIFFIPINRDKYYGLTKGKVLKREIFKQLIVEFWDSELPELVPRHKFFNILESKKPVAIIGPRRSGKTFFIFQLIKELLEQKVEKEKILYLDFEDNRLIPLEKGDEEEALEAYYELNPRGKKVEKYFFFDEIQNLPNWQSFIRRIQDKEKARIFITGSSSKMLKSELAKELRGRVIYHEMLPFSFLEFLEAKGVKIDKKTLYGSRRYIALKLLDDYLEYGGYPEVVLEENKIMKLRILQSYFDTMLYKDIIERYNIENRQLLIGLLKFMLTNIGNLFSINSYYRLVKQKMRVSKNTINNYVNYIEDSMIIYRLPKYAKSTKEKEITPRKIYAVDTGLRNAVTPRKNLVALFENFIYLHLLRLTYKYPWLKLYYWKSGKSNEVDFILTDREEPIYAIQATYMIQDEMTMRREARALEIAMKELNVDGIIVTRNQKTRYENIEVTSTLDFLINKLKELEEKII